MVLASTIDFTLPLADPVLKFLLILLIILAAPLLLNKLRIPHLLGLIKCLHHTDYSTQESE